jgi:hypothetical protein
VDNYDVAVKGKYYLRFMDVDFFEIVSRNRVPVLVGH